MHAFEWVLDAQKTTKGKIVSLIVSVALVFSLSTWSVDAFADEEQAEVTSEETVPAETETIETTAQPAALETAVSQDEIPSNVLAETETASTSATVKAAEGNRAVNDDDAPAFSADSVQSRVYVYLQIEGDATGWKESEQDGWYTLGCFDAVGLPSASTNPSDKSTHGYLSTLESKLVRFAANSGCDVDWRSIAWKAKFGIGNGATDYSQETGHSAAWHLDGVLRTTYNIAYKADGNGKVDREADSSIKNRTVNSVIGATASADQGHRFVGWYNGETFISDDPKLTPEVIERTLNKDDSGYRNTTFTAKFAKEVQVSYRWFWEDAAGNRSEDAPVATVPELPEGATLASGQNYQVAKSVTSYAPIPTYDEYGNENGSYALSRFEWPKEGQVITSNTVIAGIWRFNPKAVAKHSVTYAWSGLPEGVRFYNATGSEVEAPVLPEEAFYVKGQEYSIDKSAYSNLYVHDEYGNTIARYSFNGWSETGSQTMGETDVTVAGEWKCEKIDVPTYTVSYAWAGLPSETLYNERGEEVNLQLPQPIEGLVKGQSYQLDDMTLTGTTVVYTHDAFGNVNGKYVLGTWMDAFHGVMRDENLTVSAPWIKTAIDVDSFVVVYEYDGAVPDAAQELPKQTAYSVNQPVSLADQPSLAGWKFEGWTLPDQVSYDEGSGTFTMNEVDQDGQVIVVKGAWSPEGVDAIVADPIHAVYDGTEHSLRVNGTREGDECYFIYPNGMLFENNQRNATDGTIDVIARVWRDGVKIKDVATSVTIDRAPLSVAVKGENVERAYTGTLQTLNDFSYTVFSDNKELEELPEGVNLVADESVGAQGRDAGTYQMGLTGTKFTFEGENRNNYAIDFKVTDGMLTISPVSVFVVLDDASKVEGDDDPRFTAQILGPIYNSELSFEYMRTNTDEGAGTYEGVISAVYDENPNYIVNVFPGDFVISAAPTVMPDDPESPVVPGQDQTQDQPQGPAQDIDDGTVAGDGVGAGGTAAPAAIPGDDPAGTPPADDGAAVIPDDENPLAAPEETTIENDENPLAAFDAPQCWVHYLMIVGIILTAIYGAAVIARRLGYARKIDKFDRDLKGSAHTSSAMLNSRGTVHRA